MKKRPVQGQLKSTARKTYLKKMGFFMSKRHNACTGLAALFFIFLLTSLAIAKDWTDVELLSIKGKIWL